MLIDLINAASYFKEVEKLGPWPGATQYVHTQIRQAGGGGEAGCAVLYIFYTLYVVIIITYNVYNI